MELLNSRKLSRSVGMCKIGGGGGGGGLIDDYTKDCRPEEVLHLRSFYNDLCGLIFCVW